MPIEFGSKEAERVRRLDYKVRKGWTRDDEQVQEAVRELRKRNRKPEPLTQLEIDGAAEYRADMQRYRERLAALLAKLRAHALDW